MNKEASFLIKNDPENGEQATMHMWPAPTNEERSPNSFLSARGYLGFLLVREREKGRSVGKARGSKECATLLRSVASTVL